MKEIVKLASVRGIGVLLQVLLQFVIARLGGASALGMMQIYQTWTCVIGETTAMGLPTQTMKSVSTEKSGQVIVSRILKSLKLIFLFWVAVTAILLSASIVFPDAMLLSLGNQLALTWSVLCFAVLRVSSEALKAMGCSGLAIFSENSIVPLLVVCLCVLMIAMGFQSTSQVMGFASIGETLIYAASLFLTLAMAYGLSKCLQIARREFESIEQGTQSQLATDHSQLVLANLFSHETRFFWGTAILSIGFLNLPFLLMPFYGSVEEIGLFALAFKCINPISTILIMLGALFGPRFAKSYLEKGSHSDLKSHERLGSLLMQSQLISIGLYLPVLLPILLFAEPLLSLFGPEFRDAKNYLFILAIAQLVNAVTGLSGNMLNMIGLGKVEFQGALFFAMLAIISGLWAGSVYGLEGVAISYCASLAGKNIWSYFFALRACHFTICVSHGNSKEHIEAARSERANLKIKVA